MPHHDKMLLMFYELYKIPIKYRDIMKEIINNNRLIKTTFNKMLAFVKLKKELSDWEIVYIS